MTNFPVEGFLSYEKLQALRADLICVRVMGWADGSQGMDYTINSALGLPLMTGPLDDERPVNHVLAAWDLLTGAYSAFALMAALIARLRGVWGGYGSALWVACGIAAVGAIAIALLPAESAAAPATSAAETPRREPARR